MAKGIDNYINYFRQICVEHSMILHNPLAEFDTDKYVDECKFVMLDLDQVVTGLQKKTGNGIMVFLSPYDINPHDNGAGYFMAKYTGGFIIAKRTQLNNAIDIQQSFSETEKVVFDIINRMCADSQGTICGMPLGIIESNNFKVTPVNHIWESHYGWFVEFNFELPKMEEMDEILATDGSIWYKRDTAFVLPNFVIGNATAINDGTDLTAIFGGLPFSNFTKTKSNEAFAFADITKFSDIGASTILNNNWTWLKDSTGRITDILTDNFNDLEDIEEIVLPGVVDRLEMNVFNRLPRLHKLEMNNLLFLPENSFNELPKLTKAFLPKVQRLQFNSFTKVNVEEVYLPELAKIESESFCYLDNIKRLTLPKLVDIGVDSFNDMANLEELYLPSLANIGFNAGNDMAITNGIDQNIFKHLPNLKLIKLPQSIFTIHNGDMPETLKRLQQYGVGFKTY